MAKNSPERNPLNQLSTLFHSIHGIAEKLAPSSDAEFAAITAIRQKSACNEAAQVQALRGLHTNGKDPAFDQKIEEDIMKIHFDSMNQDREAFQSIERSRESCERQRLGFIECLKGSLVVIVLLFTDEDARKELFSIGGKLPELITSALPRK